MGKINTFITGAALGAIAALLLAPQAGERTRALVAEKANAVASEAKDFGSGIPGSAQDAFKSVQERGFDAIKGVAGKGQDLAGDVASKVKDAAGQATAPAPAAPDDELREKIEAARQRIAAQVRENAEAAKAVEVEAAEAVADAVEAAEEAVQE